MSPVTRLNLFAFLRTGFEILKVYAGRSTCAESDSTYMSVWIVFDKGQITTVVILSKGNVNSSCAVNPSLASQPLFLDTTTVARFSQILGISLIYCGLLI